MRRPDIAKGMIRYNEYYKKEKSFNNPKITSVSGKSVVYFRCKNGHDFEKIANKISRLVQIDGEIVCPICKKEGLVKIPYKPRKTWKVSLYDYCIENKEFYHLIEEWVEDKNKEINLDMKEVGYGSNKVVYWRCLKCGNIYDMKISKRTDGINCPYCAGSRLLIGFNDLESQYPEIANEWDYDKNVKKPNEVFAHSPEKVFWKCERGHTWGAEISKRTNKKKGSGCPECKHHGTSLVETVLFICLKNKFQNVKHRQKIDGLEYDIFVEDINLGIEYDGLYYHKRVEKYSRDLKKELKAKELGFNFLRISEVDDKELHNIIEENKLYWWVLKNTNYTELCKSVIGYLNRVYNCGILEEVSEDIVRAAREEMRIEQFENSLEYCYPRIAEMWDYERNGLLTPKNISKGSHYLAYWKCPACGNEFQKSVYRITEKQIKTLCKQCGRQK